MGKKTKYKCLLDRLPDSIVCHILSLLSARDAVRTSVLSRRWRYLFASSISELDFLDCLPDSSVAEHIKTNFKMFVDRLFFNPKHLRLECFTVTDIWVTDSLSDDCFLTLYNWLSAALWRGVKEIDVTFFSGNIPILPTLLFTCPSLVMLILDIIGLETKVPADVCLPNLRTIELVDIGFVDACSFHRLISGCPVLEKLLLFGCFVNGVHELNIHSLSLKSLVIDFKYSGIAVGRDFDYIFVIDAPRLVCFEYAGFVGKGYTLRNMECLEKADIELFHLDDMELERAAALLRGICNVPTLHLTIYDYGEPRLRMPLELVPVFHNLVELGFTDCGGDWKGTWIVEFLHCVPNLKKLCLNLAGADKGFKPVSEDVPSCLFHHLKEIKISNFKEHAHMFELVSYFLNHALVLELLEIYASKNRSSSIEKLCSLPQKSKKCNVVIF